MNDPRAGVDVPPLERDPLLGPQAGEPGEDGDGEKRECSSSATVSISATDSNAGTSRRFGSGLGMRVAGFSSRSLILTA
jgi:hypothetical protein